MVKEIWLDQSDESANWIKQIRPKEDVAKANAARVLVSKAFHPLKGLRKEPKSEVGYIPETSSSQRCASCKYFIKTEGEDDPAKQDGKCVKVEGAISPKATCKYYSAGWGPARDPSTGQVRVGKARSKFDVKEGDKGTLVVDEHALGLDKEESAEFEKVKTYDSWKKACSRIKGSIHSDFRFHVKEKQYWVGFETGSFSAGEANDKVLIPGFKPRVWNFAWLNEIGVGEATEWYGSRKTPTRVFQLEKCSFEILKAEEHIIEFKVTEAKYLKTGTYMLMGAPTGEERRTWMLGYKGE
jgi:hypothetical protein